ncbi:MAG: ABC transporter permease [bacterium]
MQTMDIKWTSLAFAYLLLLIPLCIAFFYKIKIISSIWVSVIRMTIQLLLVGLYLQVIFKLNHWWLNLAWLLVMIVAADLSILSRCKLRIRFFFISVFIALFSGTSIPLFYFAAVVIRLPGLIDAAYFIPLAGMIMGNCLRADIIGINAFYSSVKDREKLFLHELSQGASLSEALLPHLRSAVESALSPTVASMATIGLVALPGMMTGIILGGTSPVTAIKYQIAIMIAIFAGTSLTVTLGILISRKWAFSDWGILKPSVFK